MEPNWEKLNEVTLKAYELNRSGKLTLSKLSELEKEAEKFAKGYSLWREAFARYRHELEAKDVEEYFKS